ncbi:unnamed protein product [Oppiella nova]|uniref:Uncharacterized protein n=1 Tax=Oppiella nova TaxID=334625 RepID=A0A7R9R270_9ACAR|nr:unnamed protein product [Oppiella nova]CAG2183105.1 unnamed protein product [Oppiella nova]
MTTSVRPLPVNPPERY